MLAAKLYFHLFINSHCMNLCEILNACSLICKCDHGSFIEYFHCNNVKLSEYSADKKKIANLIDFYNCK